MKDAENGFVNIQTLFDDKTERTLEGLSHLYDDHKRLLSVVEELSAKVLNENLINGKRVLLKPNWVRQPVKEHDKLCLCTHDNFLLAVLELLLQRNPSSVIVGDAPVQGCKWEKLVTVDLIKKINELSVKYNTPVTIKDFRRTVFDTAGNTIETERNPISEYIIFDVGKKSFLEPVTKTGKNLFRVAQYNPDKFEAAHKPGVHKYCITKGLFESDIVISLPKIKTHQKAGITCALKNIVGLNGDKDYLPHHRLGGDKMGGDNYPGKNFLRYWSELAADNANRKIGSPLYWFWLRLSSLLWKISMPGKQHQLNGAWFGNDTVWRMVMDLNSIIIYGNADGTLAHTPRRSLYSFCDGIIGGQGNGPLHPDPLALGVVSFSNDSSANDICMATLLGLNTGKIPLLQAAKSFMPNRNISISLNDNTIHQNDLLQYATNATLPPGWINY